MHKILSRLKSLILIFLVIIVIIIIALLLYNRNLASLLSQTTEHTLHEILELQKENFNSAIISKMEAMNFLAEELASAPNDIEIILSILHKTLKLTKFETISIINPSGIGITNTGKIVNTKEAPCHAKAVTGTSIFCFSYNSHLGEGRIPHFTLPIFDDGHITGVLMSVYSTTELNKLLLPIFDNKGYSLIVTNNGDVVVGEKNDYMLLDDNNILDFFEKTTTEDLDDFETMKNKMAQGESGATEYSFNNQYRYAQYEPFGMNDWYIFVVVPQDIIDADIVAIRQNTIVLTISTIIVLVLFIFYALKLQIKAETKHTKELKQIAYYDDLTGLPNLAKFKIDAVKTLKENPNTIFVVAKFDIVNFKVINEIFGFKTGDTIIQQFASIVKEIRRNTKTDCLGTFARITGDEFILMEISGTIEEIKQRRSMVENAFGKYIKNILSNYQVEIRFGVYILEKGETDITNIIEKVNIAHHISKTNKKILFSYYNDALKQKLFKDAEIEGLLPAALENGEFKVYLQPKYCLDGEYIAGAEALIRWISPYGKIINPVDFIPICERNGFIVKIDMFVFEHVCKMLRNRIRAGHEPVAISVNFSRVHLENSRFVSDILAIANRYDVPAKYLEIELTESIIFDNEETLSELLLTLHHADFTLAMDDFGIGYSSLGLLQKLSVDVIKIDKSFFSDIQDQPRSRIVIESIFDMAKKLKIQTVAEGVEIKEHIDLLREIGCDMVQGYYYAKPMPAEEFFTKKHPHKTDF